MVKEYTPTVPSGPPKDTDRDPLELDDELAPGDVAGEYVIMGKIASGGCGTVYTAEHRLLGRRTAVKVLHSKLAGSPEMVERFVREAQVVNRIHHPNIVDIFDFGKLDHKKQPYFVMELLEGMNLGSIIERRGRLTPAQALGYLEPVCDALAAAHAAGVVHRDLKASNVIVVKEGDPPRVKLLDFGIAKLMKDAPGQRGLTAAGVRIGTPYAMAPEQVRGTAVDHRVDIYGLGVLLFQMLTGRYPFVSSDPVEMERMHVETPPPRPSAMAPVSPAIDAVILRTLEKDASARFPDVGSFIGALRKAVSGAGAARGEARRGVAINFDMHILGEEDEALLAGIGDLLDQTEARLREAGYSLYLQTGSALLGVKALPQDPAKAVEECKAALNLGRKLLEPLASADPRLGLSVQVHVDTAEVRDGEIIGGPLVNLEAWLQPGASGFRATNAATEGLPR